jgi:hypothetical protein
MKKIIPIMFCLSLAANMALAQAGNPGTPGTSTGQSSASPATPATSDSNVNAPRSTSPTASDSGRILNEPSGATTGTNAFGTLRTSTNAVGTNANTNLIDEPSGAGRTNRFRTNRFGTNQFGVGPEPVKPESPGTP